MIAYPVWYQGGFPDVEQVLRDLFGPLLTGVSVVSWLPPDYATHLAAGSSYLRVFRMGGRANIDSRNWVDETRVQLAALSASRDESVGLSEFARQVLLAYTDGGHVVSTATTFIQYAGELVGPQLIPEQMRDERLVVFTAEIHVDRPRGLPYYRDALHLNNT